MKWPGKPKSCLTRRRERSLGFTWWDHATDLIAESTLAIKKGCTVKDIADTIHSHPTLAEITLEAALKADDRPLHG